MLELVSTPYFHFKRESEILRGPWSRIPLKSTTVVGKGSKATEGGMLTDTNKKVVGGCGVSRQLAHEGG